MAATDRATRAQTDGDEYPLDDVHFDEAFEPGGMPREGYAEVLAALGRHDLAELRGRAQEGAGAIGLNFGPGRPFAVDPVPRLLSQREWESLEAGLKQRAQALNAFIADAYGGQRIFDAGVVPLRLLETAPGYEPRMRGLLNPEVPPATVAGMDLVRDAGGAPLVLEDNLRMPSGACYAIAMREIVSSALGAETTPLPLDGYLGELAAALRTASPQGSLDAPAAIVSDGVGSGAWFEHRVLGDALDVPVVSPEQLETQRGRLFARLGRERRQLDVIYRRLDEDRLSGADGEPTSLGELLLPALESGRLSCVNAFGAGIADDKLTHAYSEQIVRFYLGEAPLLRSVPTFDLSAEDQRQSAMERLDELVVKPRDGFGGQGVTIMPRATETERRRAIGLLRRRPDRFIAQEMVPLSRHPTVCGGRLRPRHVDFRPFVLSSRSRTTAMAGGLTRFAPAAGEMIVNSSRGGGCKDTWVLP